LPVAAEGADRKEGDSPGERKADDEVPTDVCVRFVTVCHMPRTLRVCVYAGITVIELQKLLASSFKTGNRRIVGFENKKTRTCISLGVASYSPSILSEDLRYTLLFGEGEIEDKVVPYDFECSIPRLKGFVLALLKKNVLSEAQVQTVMSMITAADRDLLLAYSFFRIDKDVQRFVATLSYLSSIDALDRVDLLSKIVAVNQCVERAGLDRAVAPWIQRQILIGHESFLRAFDAFEVSGDLAELRIVLDHVVASTSTEPEGRGDGGGDEKHEEEKEEEGDEAVAGRDHPKVATSNDRFVDLIDFLNATGDLSKADASWLRGRRVAGDTELRKVVRGFEDVRDGDVEDMMKRVLSLNMSFRSQRLESRHGLAQLIEDIPSDAATDAQRNELLALADEGNDVVLSAYEVFAVEHDVTELYETLLMLLRSVGPSGATASDDDDDDGTTIPRSIVDLTRNLVRDSSISLKIGEAILRLAGAGDPYVLAAFQVYEESPERDLEDLLDTLSRILKQRVRDAADVQSRRSGSAETSDAPRDHALAEVLRTIDAMDLDDRTRNILLQRIADDEPTLMAAIQMFKETNDAAELKDTLRLVVDTQIDVAAEEAIGTPLTLRSPASIDASIITATSESNNISRVEGAEALLSPSLSAVSTPNVSGSFMASRKLTGDAEFGDEALTAESAKKRDAAFERAIERLSSGPDALRGEQVKLLRDLRDDGDMVVCVALDFFQKNGDEAELLDTLRTAAELRLEDENDEGDAADATYLSTASP